MFEEWTKVDEVAGFLRKELGDPPQVHVVLGSGLGDAVAGMEDARSLEFADIPSWPESTVEGHAGELRRGRLAGTEVLLQMGRIHLYEGYSPSAVVRPVRAAIAWGAETVVLTNAAGGVNPALRAGDLMMLEDHLNLTGRTPLLGINDETRGPRFPDMTNIYDSGLRARALNAAAEMGIALRNGVYAGLLGPSYETPSEVKMLAALGADAVGMSTVLEAIAARHMGARLCGISCITNQAASAHGPKLTHDEVKVFAAKAADDMTRLIASVIGDTGEDA